MNTMPRTLFIVLTLVFSASIGFAQPKKESITTLFNDFQRFYAEKKLDSAYQNAQKLARLNSNVLNKLIHESLTQSFRPSASAEVDKSLAQKLLRRMYTDTSSRSLQQSVYPLYKWVDVMTNLNDSAKIRQIVSGFLVALERSPEEPGNRVDRYALLVYKLLKQNPAYTPLADTLFKHTQARLQHALNSRYFQGEDGIAPQLREGRAYFRYLLAYSNDLKANELIGKNKSIDQEQYRKVASDFSPDETDRQLVSAYFYESVMLFDGERKDDFHQSYANMLLEKGDTLSAIKVLTDIALADPGKINLLKTYYQKLPQSGLPFSAYWTKALNEKLKPAETFSLVSFDKQVFNYEQLKGKWILIDFWGTWCKPCVGELPELQTFYTNVVKNNRKDLIVFTVDCHDASPEVVQAFMQKNNYTFPVVTGDEKLIKQFRVGSYPTKVLITPQGNRMKIPFGVNWTERVNAYTSN
ncbi:TlpA family protein disulfide reductase [Fibrella sp. HMF5335]|uniref:TlpA family protein disulfide reductase n=1 Tax=Fibrella rubiginis TaxID=2817060 RepID=A0A939G9P7_9BACT|nr:TlpA disulfide reductase family protein [Fibrella rubiginis]MBO0935037.1 TlpA family protein disulfide reductase [Fibrella rubiginis]